MDNPDILTKIKTLLGIESKEVKLAQMKLEDGMTIVESENFEEGDEIVIITEDGKVAMPIGDYSLEDGRMLVVKEEGLIAEVKGKEEEEKEEVTEEIEEEAKSEEKEEYAEETKEPKKIVKSVSEEIHFTEIEKLKEENETLKKQLEGLKLSSEDSEKTEMSKEVKETEKIEPIVHNPESKKAIDGFKYAQNRTKTTLDRVMEKLSK